MRIFKNIPKTEFDISYILFTFAEHNPMNIIEKNLSMDRMIFFTTVALLGFLSGGCGKETYGELTGDIWNTSYHIKYDSDLPLQDSILRIFQDIDGSLSMFNEASLISRINRNDSTARADEMLCQVFDKSKIISSVSGGAFDPTIAPLVNLWGFGREKDNLSEPADDEISKTLVSVGISECKIDPEGRLIKKSQETQFDFSAIAKGYACDKIAELLRRNNVNNFLIEIGGEIYAGGKNPDGKAWKIMIENPLDSSGVTGNSALKFVDLSDKAIATSGNYRKFRKHNNQIISHILDPRTGYPCKIDIISATVIAPDCMTADALATACMVMSPDSAMRMLKNFGNVEGLIVTEKTHHFSFGLRSGKK